MKKFLTTASSEDVIVTFCWTGNSHKFQQTVSPTCQQMLEWAFERDAFYILCCIAWTSWMRPISLHGWLSVS